MTGNCEYGRSNLSWRMRPWRPGRENKGGQNGSTEGLEVETKEVVELQNADNY